MLSPRKSPSRNARHKTHSTPNPPPSHKSNAALRPLRTHPHLRSLQFSSPLPPRPSQSQSGGTSPPRPAKPSPAFLSLSPIAAVTPRDQSPASRAPQDAAPSQRKTASLRATQAPAPTKHYSQASDAHPKANATNTPPNPRRLTSASTHTAVPSTDDSRSRTTHDAPPTNSPPLQSPAEPSPNSHPPPPRSASPARYSPPATHSPPPDNPKTPPSPKSDPHTQQSLITRLQPCRIELRPTTIVQPRPIPNCYLLANSPNVASFGNADAFTPENR